MTDSELKAKSDRELAADTYMVTQELSRLRLELTRRKIESDLSTYINGRTEVQIYRDKRENL